MSSRIRRSLVLGIDGAFGKPCSIAATLSDMSKIYLYRTGKVAVKKDLVNKGENVPAYRLRDLHNSYTEVLDRIYAKFYYDISDLFVGIELPSIMGMGNTAANLGLASGSIFASTLAYMDKHRYVNTEIKFVAPTSWRKIALGRGNLKKAEVQRTAQRMYKNVEYVNEIGPNAKLNDDDWDAIGICIYGVLQKR